MSIQAKAPVKWEYLRHRYLRSSKAKRSILLDEITDITNMNRKYLIRKFNKKKVRVKNKRGRKPKYDPKTYGPIIKKLWLAADQPCSKKLKVIILTWMPYYENEAVANWQKIILNRKQ